MRSLSPLAPLILAVAAVVACDDDRILEPQPFATLRIVNATGVDTVGFFPDGGMYPLIWAVNRQASVCIPVPTRIEQIEFRRLREEADLVAIPADLDPDQRYTVIVADTTSPREAILLPEGVPAPDTATSILVRFVNAGSTPVDVYATPPGGALTTPVVSNLAPITEAADLPVHITLPKANTQIRFFDVGTTATARATLNLTGLPAHKTTNAVFMEAGGATAVRVDPCT